MPAAGAPVIEYYRRRDFAAGDLAASAGPRDLLRWALDADRRAPPEALYRDKEGRRTLRLRLPEGEFFLKLHRGVGWREILKNLARGRRPVLGAADEFQALRRLPDLGVSVPAVAAYASLGGNPAARRSLIVTDALRDTISLEDYCADWAARPPPPAERMGLIRAVADVARRLHDAGWNHRDFYLCHFHLEPASLAGTHPRLYLIDLHRARHRARLPVRWRVKDLAALYFSARDCGLERRDLLRFMRHYSPGGLRGALEQRERLWRRVERKADALYYNCPTSLQMRPGARKR